MTVSLAEKQAKFAEAKKQLDEVNAAKAELQ